VTKIVAIYSVSHRGFIASGLLTNLFTYLCPSPA